MTSGAARSWGGGNRLESSPQRGEEAIASERLASVTSAGEGDLDAKISRGIDVKSVTGKINCHALLFEGEVVSSIQSTPSPEFLNSLPFIKKFFPAPRWGEGKFTKVSHNNSCNSRHSERQRTLKGILPRTARYSPTMQAKNLAYLLYSTSKLKGIHMNNLTETAQPSMPLGIFASKYDVGIAMPTYFAVYPSKSSLTREDLSFGKIVHYNNFNLTETVHSPFTTHNSLKKSAFTLAEVLITLGIIGVVAALTLPSVINKYRAFVLEQQFKKSYSNLSQTIIDMKRDSGLEHLRDNYVHYDTNSGYDSTLVKAFYDSFDSHIAPVDKLKKIYPVTNYNGTGALDVDLGGDLPKATIILKDGSSVGRWVNNGCLRFWIDSNGPYKKPNRYGFDIFEFRVCDSTDVLKPVKAYKNNYTDEELEKEKYPYIAGAPCTKKSKQLLNGIGCSWYALNNINPDDNSKKYWDSLPW